MYNVLSAKVYRYIDGDVKNLKYLAWKSSQRRLKLISKMISHTAHIRPNKCLNKNIVNTLKLIINTFLTQEWEKYNPVPINE